MKSREWILPEYPEDHQVYVTQFEVAGVLYRKESVERLLKFKAPYLRLMAEPKNPHDRNAIKVIGCAKGWFRTKTFHLGYIPADLAAKIVKKRILPLLFPRLRMIEVGNFFRVVMELTGPKGGKNDFVS